MSINLRWIVPFLGFCLGYVLFYFFLQKETIMVPNVVGKHIGDALVTVGQAQLGLTLLREQEDASLPDRTVLDQLPVAGESIRFNKNVYITLTRLPAIKKAPTLFGLSQEAAKREAQNANVRLLTFFYPASYPQGTCFAQFPNPNEDLTDNILVAYFAQEQECWYIMPNFKEQCLRDVVDDLRRFNIKPDVITSGDNPTFSYNNVRVKEQRPLPGTLFDITKPIVVQLLVE